MSQEEIFINGELLRLSREARGWVINDMATRACMSVKQIRQLEEGGMSAFYSAAVKATSAKKVGSLLGLSADQVFSQTEAVLEIEDAIAPEALIEKTDAESDKSVSAEPEVAKPEYPAEPVIKALAQVPAATPAEPEVVQPTTDETPSSKNSLWMIAVLLAVALALGAYFQPQEEPVAAEPVPPIQVLPNDAVDPASAASAADSAASSAEVALIQASAPAAMTLQKPASTGSAIVSPAVSPVASVARVVAPVASATATAAAPRVSSPAAVSTPTASAVVKAP